MSKLLIKEYPLMILPSLAVKLGLNEAVVLQQIHYWLEKSKHVKEKRNWVYNTYNDWRKQLPFWSESTIKRTIKSLEKQGYLISSNFNQFKMDQTKWYSINYELLAELNEVALHEQTDVQIDRIDHSVRPRQESRLARPIPEINTETTTEVIL